MKVSKAYEITDAKIQFVSLVDKAANLKKFLITKAADGKTASFSHYGRIIAKDAEHHFVTGIVYEPLEEDAHDNFMTEEEITKAAYYFAKAGGKIDLQHNFEPLAGATVVETWIAKADFEIDGEPVKKGTWLMTVELTDAALWDAVEKGEITGFSMGGVGNYSEEDVDLSEVNKAAGAATTPQQDQTEKKGIMKRLAEFLGVDIVEKGEMADLYAQRSRSNAFWTAFGTLEDVLCHYDPWTYNETLETDEATIKAALSDFNKIVTEILTGGTPVAKAIMTEEPVVKVGKKMSGKNKETLQGIYETLGTFLAEFDEPDEAKEEKEKKDADGAGAEGGTDDGNNGDPKNKEDKKEDEDVKKSEVEKIVNEAVAQAVTKAMGQPQQPAAKPSEEITAEGIQKMVEEAVNKALTPPEQDEPVTAEGIAKMVQEAVNNAVEPVLKARGLPSAMNDGGTAAVEKQEEVHYLHGLL